MASDKFFQSDPLFDYLPSFWKADFADRSVLETAYEALVRSMDVDWIRLLSADASKDLSTAPVTVLHPLVHQELPSWESLGVPHAHYHEWFNWPAASGDPATYQIRVEGHVLGTPQLFLDGRAVPSFVYQLDTNHWVDSGVVTYGTTIVFEASKLDSFISGDYLSSEGQDGSNTSQEWTPADQISRLGVLAYRDLRPFTGESDGSTEAYELTLNGEAATIEDFDSKLVIESFNVLNLVTVTAISGGWSVTPSASGGFGAGMLLQVTFSDDSQEVRELVSGSNTLTFTTGATITAVRLFVDIPMGAQHYKVTNRGVEMLGGGVFPGGTTVRVRDARGIVSTTLGNPRSKVSFHRDIDINSAQVLFLGTSLLELVITESTVTFKRPLLTGTRWRLDAPIVVEHDHALYRTATDGTALVTLPVTRPLSLVGGLITEDHPVLVWVEGVLVDPADITPVSATVLDLGQALPTGIAVDIWYVDDEEPIEHLHTQLTYTVPLAVPEQFSTSYAEPQTFNSVDWPVTVFRDGFLENDPDALVFVDGQFIQFASALTPGIITQADGIRREHRYQHELPDRQDIDYNHLSRITKIGRVMNGVKTPTMDLEPGLAGFMLDSGTDTKLPVLRMSQTLDKAWFEDVEVDEHNLRRIWGEPIGIEQSSSSAAYRDMLAAAYAAYRGPSFADSLVNFGSIIMGSAFIPVAGFSQGIISSAQGQVVRIQPTDPTKAMIDVPLIDDQANRVLDSNLEMGKLHAVNRLINLTDRDLSGVPWLAFMAQDLSDDYSYAKRLDVRSAWSVSGQPASYDKDTGYLTDYAVNFHDQEVWAGDLTKLILASTISPVSTVITYTDDQQSSGEVGRLTYDAASQPTQLGLHVSSPAPSNWTTGYHVTLTGAGSPWDTAVGEAFEVISASPGVGAAGSTKVTAKWLQTHAAPSTNAANVSSPFPQAQGVIKETSTTTPKVLESAQYAMVQAVIDAHTIQVPLVLTPQVTGYGDEAYGQHAYGGSIIYAAPQAYTIWTRRTRPVDSYLTLDTALDQTQALVPGETVQLLNTELAKILEAHVFTLRLEWEQMVDGERLANLGTLIQQIRPAETRALVYTEAFPGGALVEALVGSVVDTGPDLGSSPLADMLFSGESWLTSGSLSIFGPNLNYLYKPWEHQFGPILKAELKTPPDSPAVRGFYLAAPQGQISHTGAWAKTFDPGRGLDGLVLQYQESPDRWVVDGGLGARAGHAIDMTSGLRRLQAGSGSATKLHAAQTLSYTAGDPLTTHATVYIPSGAYSTPGTKYISSMSPSMFQMALEVTSPALVQPLFQAHSGETLALAASPSASYYDRWLGLTGVYREGAGGYWYSDLYVDGLLVATSSPSSSPSVTVVPSASSTSLVLGGLTPSSPTAGTSFSGMLDEFRLYAGTELASPDVAAIWNSGSPVMPTFGIEAATASPIVPSGITAWYMGDRHVPGKVTDLSGRGYLAAKLSAVAGELMLDWRSEGLTKVRFPQSGDTYEIQVGGQYVDQGVVKSTLLGVPPSVAATEDVISQITGEPTLIPTLFGYNDLQYTNPVPWLHYRDTEGWLVTTSNPQAPGSSITLDQDAVFAGFASPSVPDASGTVHLPLASDLAITGSRLVVTVGQANAGAITQLALDSSPLINNLIKGRMGQWSCAYTGRGFERFLTEAGRIDLSPAAASTSVWIDGEAGYNTVTTSSYMGLGFGSKAYEGETYGASATRLDKHIELAFNQNPNVVKIDAAFHLESSTKDGSWRNQFSIGLVPELRNVWTFRPGVQAFPTPAVFADALTVDTNFVGGVLLASDDQTKVMGIFHRKPGVAGGFFQTQVLPAGSAVGSSPTSEAFTLVNDQEFLGAASGMAIGAFRTDRYLVVGDAVEVIGAFNQLAFELEGITPLILGPAPASHITITQQPTSVAIGESFVLKAEARGTTGLVDTSYAQQALISLTVGQGTLTGVTTPAFVSGVLTTGSLSISPGGLYELNVNSGGLAPGVVALAVNNPTPVVTGTAAWAISPSEVPIQVIGQDFMSTSTAWSTGWGGTPDPIQSTLLYVSPGEVQFTPAAAVLAAYPLTLAFHISNPGPGGGSTSSLALSIYSPGGTPVILSPVADQLLWTVPPYLPAVPRVGEITLFGMAGIDTALNDAVDIDLLGTVTLSPVSQPAGAVISGTLTQAVGAVLAGHVAFPGITFDTAGDYVFTGLHSSPATVAAASPLAMTVANMVPVLDSVLPVEAAKGTQSLTLQAFGQDFVDGDSIINLSGFPRATSFVSPGELTYAMVPADFLLSQTYPVTVVTAIGGGTSAPVAFEVLGAPGSGLTEEDLNPSLLVLSPSAFQRLLPTVGAVQTTPVGQALHRAMDQVGLATGGAPIHAHDGAVGALEVISVQAGAYNSLGTRPGTQAIPLNNVNITHAPSADHPLIIRAAKWDALRAPDPLVIGEPEPVMLMPITPDLFGSADTIYHRRDPLSSHWHLYDIKIVPSSRSGMLIADNKTTSADNPYNSWLGWHMHRCPILGRIDHRVYRLTEDRWIVGPQEPVAVLNQYDTGGNLLVHKDWQLDDLHRARFGKRLTSSNVLTSDNASLNSVVEGGLVTLHTAVFGDNANLKRLGAVPASGAQLAHVGLGLTKDGAIITQVVDTDFVSTVAPFDVIASPLEFASPASLAYTMELEWQSSSTFDAAPGTGVIQVHDRVDNTTITPSYTVTVGGSASPISVPMYHGMAAAHMSFTGRGCYVFKATVKDEWGVTVPDPSNPANALSRNMVVQVTGDGLTEAPTTLVPVYDLPDVHQINRSTSSGSLAGTHEPFSVMLECQTAGARLAQDVSGSVVVSLISLDTTEGTSLKAFANYPSYQRVQVISGGVCHIRQLSIAVMPLSGAFQAALDAAGSANNYAIMTVGFAVSGTGTALDGQTFTYDVGIWPNGGMFGLDPTTIPAAALAYPWAARITEKAWLGLTLDGYGELLASTMGSAETGAPVNARVITSMGLPFWSGWPGDPSHPNYRPGYEALYPDPANCPGLVYLGYPDLPDQKWGALPFYTEDWHYDGGTVINIGMEHAFYGHNFVGDTSITNTVIARTGRTGIQKDDRMLENPYAGFSYTGDPNDTGGPGAGVFRIDNVTISETGLSETGLSDVGAAITLSGHGPDGEQIVSNCVIRNGYDDSLAAHRYISGTGLFPSLLTVWGAWTASHGPLSQELNNTLWGEGFKSDGYQQWNPFLRRTSGAPVFTYNEVQTHLAPKYDLFGAYGLIGDPTFTPVPTPAYYTNLLYGAPLFPYAGQQLGLTLGSEELGVSPKVYDGPDIAPYGMGSPTFASMHQTGKVTLLDNTFEANTPNAALAWSSGLPSLNPYGTVFGTGSTYSADPTLNLSDIRELVMQGNTIHQSGSTVIDFDQIHETWTSPGEKQAPYPSGIPGGDKRWKTRNAAIWQILGGDNTIDLASAVIRRYGKAAPAALVSQLTSPSN